MALASAFQEPLSIAHGIFCNNAGGADDDDDMDSVSPRTLKQAADRLAQFTSDQPAGLSCSRTLHLLDPLLELSMPHHAIQSWPGTWVLHSCMSGLGPVLVVESLISAHCMLQYTFSTMSHAVCAAATVPRNEFSDVYNEVGPDNVGGMGDEPSCTITLFLLRDAARRGNVGSEVSGTQACADTSGAAKEDAISETACTAQQDMNAQHLPHGTATATEDAAHKDGDQQSSYVAVDQVECDPHKVVALRPGQHKQMLLGLSNDVDCATVAFNCSSKPVLDSQHCHSIPALAYLAAGQSQAPLYSISHTCVHHQI